MSKTDTWFPLYIADYLADTMVLTTIEHGAYLLLLMQYWRKGPLPNDDKELAAITKVDRALWESEVGPAVRKFFTLECDGLLHQKRVDAEKKKAADLSEKRRVAAGNRNHKQATSKHDGKTDAIEQQVPSKLDAIAPSIAAILQPYSSGAESPDSARFEQIRCKPDAIADLKPQTESKSDAIAPAIADDLQDSLSRDNSQVHLKEERKKESAATAAVGNQALTIRDALWRDGPPIVQNLVGCSERETRGLLGKMLKNAHNDCRAVYDAVRAAEDQKPMNPRAWLLTASVPFSERGVESVPPPEPSASNPAGRRFIPIANGL